MSLLFATAEKGMVFGRAKQTGNLTTRRRKYV